MPFFRKKDQVGESLRTNTSMENFGYSSVSSQSREFHEGHSRFESGAQLSTVMETERALYGAERDLRMSGGVMAASYESMHFSQQATPQSYPSLVHSVQAGFAAEKEAYHIAPHAHNNGIPRQYLQGPSLGSVRPPVLARSTPNHLFRLNDFDLIKTLGTSSLISGTGTFGRVYLAVYKGSKKFFAMKVMRKAEVVRLRQVEHIYSEKFLLSNIRFPFIVHLYVDFLHLDMGLFKTKEIYTCS